MQKSIKLTIVEPYILRYLVRNFTQNYKIKSVTDGVESKMAKDNITTNRRNIAIAYAFMFLTLFTFVFGLFTYLLARKVSKSKNLEVWLEAQAFWIMRTVLIYTVIFLFAALWFIPLYFYYWDTFMWVTTCTIIGFVFAVIAFLFLLNSWLKGLSKFYNNKAVF